MSISIGIQERKNFTKMPGREEIASAYERLRPQYDALCLKLCKSVRNLLNRNGMNATIKCRIKTFESYFKKLLRLHSMNTQPVMITDILGIRIICPFLEDLDSAVALMTKSFSVNEVERKGSQHSSREFGYNSIHLLIDLSDDLAFSSIPYTRNVCEIQLRTILQEAWAEVEHELIYKAGFSLLNGSIKRKLASLNATLTLSDIIFQEIRDYQKTIQNCSEKRREIMQEKLHMVEQVAILDGMKDPMQQERKHGPAVPEKTQSRLEKLIFDALSAHGHNQFKKAVRLYSRILSMRPPLQARSVIYNHRGMAYFALSEYQKSIRDFSRALVKNPENFSALNNRGFAYRMVHKYEKALKDFDRSLEINAYQEEGYYGRSLTRCDLHDYAKAMEDCETALNIKSDFAPARHLKTIISNKIVSYNEKND